MAESGSEMGPAPEMPAEAKKRPWMKLVAVLVAVIVIIVAVAAWYLSQGPVTPPPENQAPTIVSVSADRVAADVNAAISFTASAEDPDDDQLTYTWDFGDNTTATGATTSHAYTFAGNFIAIVTVSDGKGHKVSSDTKPVFAFVNPAANPVPSVPTATPKPAAVLSSSANVIQAGQSVTVNGNSSWTWAWTEDPVTCDPDPACWTQQFPINTSALPVIEFNWGDGTAPVTGSGWAFALKAHAFSAAGSHLVSLRVANYLGQSDTVGYTVRVTAAAPPTGIVKNPGVFTDVLFGEPDSLDPGYDNETSGGQVIQNVAETLIWYDREKADVFKPMLATKVPSLTDPADVSPDGMTYNFTLKSGLKFHSGNDVNCAAVEFSIERTMWLNDPDGPAWILDQSLTGYAKDDPATPNVDERLVAIQASVTCPEGATGLKVQFHLVIPYPAFIPTLAITAASVIDPAPTSYQVTGRCPTQDLFQNYCHDQLVGTGPFKLRVWQPNQQIILDRNDQYHRTVANFKEVHILKANDVATRVLMLKAGDADSISLPFNHKDDIRSGGQVLPGLTEYSGDTFVVQFIGFNRGINLTAAGSDVDVPSDFFLDVHLRLAFSYVWRYNDFIQNVTYGYGSQLCSAVPKGMLGYDATVPCYSYDLATAEAHFRMAEDTRTGPPGDTYWDNGFHLTVYYNIGNTVREEGARMLEQTLEAMNPNFAIDVRSLEWESFLSNVRTRTPALFFLGRAPDYADPDDYVYPFLHSGQTYTRRIGYTNTTLDDLIDRQAQELNLTVRLNLLKQIQRAPYYDVPYLWLYQARSNDVFRSWVTGYYSNPMTFAGTGNYYYDLDK